MQNQGLPADYLELVRQTLATEHLPEQQEVMDRIRGMRTHRQNPTPPIALLPGLTDAEFAALEEAHGLRFPPDLRSFLQAMLPIRGIEFPNWRDDAAHELERTAAYLLGGIWDDIDRPEYFEPDGQGDWRLAVWESRRWVASWGPAPQNRDATQSFLRAQFERAPHFIRIYSHRFLPDRPLQSGNPVFSIVQTDIIHYGADLVDYFHHEFGVPRPAWAAREPRRIDFWSDLVDANG